MGDSDNRPCCRKVRLKVGVTAEMVNKRGAMAANRDVYCW